VHLSIRYLKANLRRAGAGRLVGDEENIEPALFVAEYFGIPLDSYWPFIPNRPGRPRKAGRRIARDGMRWFKARSFRLQSLADIPDQLKAKRPVLAHLPIHFGNGWYGKGVIVVPSASDRISDGTVVTIVAKGNRGYRFANNWGAEWAENGFGWMTEDAAKFLIDGLWSIEAYESPTKV